MTLLKQLKNNGSDFSIKPSALLANSGANTSKQDNIVKKKTKREEMIDNKIEKLLISYKAKDE